MTQLIGLIDADARTIDENRGLCRTAFPKYAIGPDADPFDVIAGGDHREQNVNTCQVSQLIDDVRATLTERLRLRLGPIPDR
jgi:hypothetical protein